MTFYLLVLTEDGGSVSYSLWKTKESAKFEMSQLMKEFRFTIYNFNLVEIEAYD